MLGVGLLVANLMLHRLGSAKVLAWRRRWRGWALIVGFSGIISGENEATWVEAKLTKLLSTLMGTGTVDGLTFFGDWLRRLTLITAFVLFVVGMLVLLFRMSRFWPGYAEQKKAEADADGVGA